MPIKLKPLVEPPRCQAPGRGVRSHRRTCPTCRTWDNYVALLRQRAVRAGEHVPQPDGPNLARRKPELLIPVPKCRGPHPAGTTRYTCPKCIARNTYVGARRRDEMRRGVYANELVPAAPYVAHARTLVETGGWTRAALAERTGIFRKYLDRLLSGKTEYLQRITADSIIAVQPRDGIPLARRADEVCPVGSRRRLRGLARQGFTWLYLAPLLDVSPSRVGQWARGAHDGIRTSTAEKIKTLADKLSELDIEEVDEPIDGMSWAAARNATRKGWRRLADWEGLDIDDPKAEPREYAADYLCAGENVIIDEIKMDIILIERQPMRITRAEQAAVVTRGLANGLSRSEIIRLARTSGTHLGQLIEMPAVVDRFINRSPAPDDPDPREREHGYLRTMTVLTITQPPPYGRGLGDDVLAELFDVGPEKATKLRRRAVEIAGRLVGRS